MGIDALSLALFLGASLRLAAPVLLASLGEVVSERAGMFNIGLEGLMLIAAFCSVWGLGLFHSAAVGLAMGVAGGLAGGLVLALLIAVLRADQIVVGIGFNILALGATSWGRQTLLSDPPHGIPLRHLSVWHVPGLSRLPVLGASMFSQSPILYAGCVIAVLVWAILRWRRLGLVLRAVGESAAAADAAGTSVMLVRTGALAFGGVLAGLSGVYLALVASGGTFVDNMSAGRGYLAIAVTLFGRWHPLWALLAALLFGCVDALQYQAQLHGLQVSSSLLLMMPFLLALIGWAALGGSSAGPGDLGRPFIRGGR